VLSAAEKIPAAHAKILEQIIFRNGDFMLNYVFGVMFVFSQLSGAGGSLPQILHPDFKPPSPIKAGKKFEVIVLFTATKGYSIDRTLPLTLKLTAVPGLAFEKTDLAASSNDPKAKDNYYVDLPTIKVPVTASKAGKYEVPGKLKYFFCSKTDGFCSFQILDVRIPFSVE
jgi:hypothetical protein